MQIARRTSALLTFLLLVLASCGPRLGPCYTGAVKFRRSVIEFDIDGDAQKFQKEIIAAAEVWNEAQSGLAFRYRVGSSSIVHAVPGNHRVIALATSMYNATPAAVTQSLVVRGIVIMETFLNLSVDLSTNTPATGIDVQATMVHEFGHWVMFPDIREPECAQTTVMFVRTQAGQMRRTITEQDKTALRTLYPR